MHEVSQRLSIDCRPFKSLRNLLRQSQPVKKIMRIVRERLCAFRFARQTITNRWKLARRCALATERAKAGGELCECLWPCALCGMFLQSAQSFFREDRFASRIA